VRDAVYGKTMIEAFFTFSYLLLPFSFITGYGKTMIAALFTFFFLLLPFSFITGYGIRVTGKQ
jgi:hypothetical protein